MTKSTVYHLFDVFGVELEYMIVDRDSLNVLPVADRLLGIDGGDENEVRVGDLCWSNELVLHVVEFKTCGPEPSLDGLAKLFQQGVSEAIARLKPMNGCLMPTAMHPWMDPLKETVLWPHGNREIYEAFDRIFGCKGHGWSNLQSAHLNLPFHGDDEFGRLHAAIRVLLPILPALSASSPFVDGKASRLLDNRLDVYRTNCRRIPSVTGKVIPEPVFTCDDYQERILKPMYTDIAPFDPDGTLQDEWLNARGAIARFERDTIEIRVLDVQECPEADLAIITLVVETLKALCSELWSSFDKQKAWSVERLESIFLNVVACGGDAMIDDNDYLALFGHEGPSCSASELWRLVLSDLRGRTSALDASEEALRLIIDKGCLAKRVLAQLPDRSPASIYALYRKLCVGLEHGAMLRS